MTVDKTEERRLDQIPKAYEPQAVEQRLYRWWEENGYFKPRENPKDPGVSRLSSACRRPTSRARYTWATQSLRRSKTS